MEHIFEEGNYTGPAIISLPIPHKVKLCELEDFLNKLLPDRYKYNIFQVEEFEYGDFDNHVTAVVHSKTIDPRFCRYYPVNTGIYKAGSTSFCVKTTFWYYRPNDAFWRESLEDGYDGCNMSHVKEHITDLETTIEKVFVISKEDFINLYREKIKK